MMKEKCSWITKVDMSVLYITSIKPSMLSFYMGKFHVIIDPHVIAIVFTLRSDE